MAAPDPAVPAGPLTRPAAKEHGRAGRDLRAAIGVGVGLGAYIILSLAFFNPAFVALVAVAMSLGSLELHKALQKQDMHAAIVPIIGGTVAIVIGSYLAGQVTPPRFSTTSVLIASLGLTVLAALVWRMPGGATGYVRDVAASLLIISYVPLLGSFCALMLAAEQGPGRVVTFLLVVVANDTGGYVAGVLFGRHPMARSISPKKSWEGFVGSVVFGTAAGAAMASLLLDAPVWVGLLLGACLVVSATLGDLVESLIKRDLGIKDMSSFLPGHGGVMDRLDSLLVSAPVAWLIMYLLVPGG